MRFKNQQYPILIHISAVSELLGMQVDDEGLTIGASVSLSQIDELLQKQINILPGEDITLNMYVYD